MALAIHRATPVTIQRDDVGWPVFAVQRVLNQPFAIRVDGNAIAEDMAFGPRTHKAVQILQSRLALTTDGKVGPVTQASIADFLCRMEEIAQPSLPDGLVAAQVSGESTKRIASVAWGSPGGVDCGYTSRRVYDDDYGDEAVIKRAFDSAYQIDLLAKSLINLRSIFGARAGTKAGWDGLSLNEFAWRLALLNHNYPTAADKISRYGISSLSSYWHTSQSWVVAIEAKFENGVAVKTPFEWCCYYSLGSKKNRHSGAMTEGITSWT